MFKDSKIVQNFKLGKTKCSYVICHGLVPYFWESLAEQLLKVPFIVTMFNQNESSNSTVKKSQMDLEVRFWNEEKGQVDTCYYILSNNSVATS